MSHSDDSSLLNFYQFPRWSTSITRPQSGLSSQNVNDMFKLGIDNRNQLDKSDSSSSKKRHIQHNLHIRRGSRVLSPPFLHQPTPTPDFCSVVDYVLPISPPSYNLTPVRIKSAALTIPIKTNLEEISLKSFPKQSHERRKIAQDKKRRKQQAQKYADTDCDTWFQLRQSLVELKHLATTEEVLLDPTTSVFNCDGFSFDALKQVINEQQEEKKIIKFISESGW
jgi:hypothetical protein